jgi:hypothetical protein
MSNLKLNETDVREEIRIAGQRADAFILDVTPDIARRLLASMTNYRPISRTTVDRYRRVLRDGEWKYTGQGVIVATNGCTLDAQHRLTAISEEGVAARLLVVMDVSPDVWRYLDQGKARSGSDLIGCANSVTAAAVCYRLHAEESTKTACGVRKGAGVRLRASDVPIVLDYYPEVEAATAWAVEHKKEIDAAPAVVAYAYLRARLHNAALADDFFSSLTTGVGLPEGSPVLALRNFLTKNKADRKKFPTQIIVAAFVKTWTAAVEGRAIQKLGIKNSEPAKLTWPGPRQERLPSRFRVDLRVVEAS